MVRILVVRILVAKTHVVLMAMEPLQFLVQVVKIAAVLTIAERNLLLVGAVNIVMRPILLLHVARHVRVAVDLVVQIAVVNMILLVLI